MEGQQPSIFSEIFSEIKGAGEKSQPGITAQSQPGRRALHEGAQVKNKRAPQMATL
jgi:hypothetical protein